MVELCMYRMGVATATVDEEEGAARIRQYALDAQQHGRTAHVSHGSGGARDVSYTHSMLQMTI